MNSTLKSLLFWMALVVLGVLIWNFSTRFQKPERTVTFSEFSEAVHTVGLFWLLLNQPPPEPPP